MPVGESAYIPLANVTLGSSASTVTFSSISQSYRDLVVVVYFQTTGTAFARFRINGDAGSTYSYVSAENGGSAQSNLSSGGNNIPLPFGGAAESTSWWVDQINFMDYTNTGKFKAGLMTSSNPYQDQRHSMVCFQWNSTSAITQIQFIGNNQPFATGSTFALYGVTA